MIRTRFISALLASVLLASCGLLPEQIDETKDWTASKFYAEASEALAGKDYERAIELYEKLESRFPFGPYALQAQLDVAYAYYLYEEPDSAIAAADRFIRLHPRNPFVDYAYYLKGIVNFNRSVGFFDRFVPTDPSQRDPGSALDSFKDFSELVRRFPDSRYAPDARKRMLYLRNNLAQYQVNVADYYFRRGAYLAAANRGGVRDRALPAHPGGQTGIGDDDQILSETRHGRTGRRRRTGAGDQRTEGHPAHPRLRTGQEMG